MADDELEVATRLRDDLANKVQDAMQSAYPGDLVTSWYVISQQLDGETGQTSQVMISPADMRTWTSLGMLEYAAEFERMRVHQQLDPDD